MNHTQTIVTAKEATFIPMKASSGNAPALSNLLKGAAQIVHETEPQTLQWLALQESEDQFAIADFFPNSEGRNAHFAGQVAAALKKSAGVVVEGGWEKGVVANVENSRILSYVVREIEPRQARLATRIDIQAKPGKEEALAGLLTGAAALVEATEPGTLLWYAIRINQSGFAIFDIFASEDGRAAHFAGKVAAALKENSEQMVQGGWDSGVVAKIKNYLVLSATF